MFANKNKEEPQGNTITKMFKNAPPPRVKPKRTVDDISGAEDQPIKNESSQKLKTEVTSKINSLDKFKFGASKTVNNSIVEPEIKNTEYGISNPDLAVKVKSNKGLVQLMKDSLEKDKII